MLTNPKTGDPLLPIMKDCLHGKHPRGLYPSYRNGKIALAPKNDLTEKLAAYFKNYEYDSFFFNSK